MLSGIIVNTLVAGVIYAILALGFSLIFGVAKILNMAHTALYMVAGFIIFIGLQMIRLPLYLCDILAIVLTAILAMICYRLVFDRVKIQTSAVMIISIALAMLFQELLLMQFGAQPRQIPPFIPGYIEFLGSRVTYQHIFSFASFLALICAIWFLMIKTRLGKIIRAVSEDPEVSNLMGINVTRISLIAMGISGGLAGFAAVIVVPLFTLHSLMWISPLVTIMAVVVLGGLGSIKGSVIGAFILGFAETAVSMLVPLGSFLSGAVSLTIMILVLVIRPEGLFGVAFEEERL